MRLRSLLLAIVAIAGLIMIGGAFSGWPRSFAAELPWLDPDWLQAHVGEGEGQIAPVVLQRARALYLKKVCALVAGEVSAKIKADAGGTTAKDLKDASSVCDQKAAL